MHLKSCFLILALLFIQHPEAVRLTSLQEWTIDGNDKESWRALKDIVESKPGGRRGEYWDGGAGFKVYSGGFNTRLRLKMSKEQYEDRLHLKLYPTHCSYPEEGNLYCMITGPANVTVLNAAGSESYTIGARELMFCIVKPEFRKCDLNKFGLEPKSRDEDLRFGAEQN